MKYSDASQCDNSHPGSELIQWPREYLASTRRYTTSPPLNFKEFLEVVPEKLPQTFDLIVNWVISEGGDIASFEEKVASLLNELSFQSYPKGKELLMVHICSTALFKMPSVETWERVRTLKNSSTVLEYNLSDALLAYAVDNPDIRSAYIHLAKEVVSALANGKLESQFDQLNDERATLSSRWEKIHTSLTKYGFG